MATQKCKDNVGKMPPPYNKFCSLKHCEDVSFNIGQHCGIDPAFPIDQPIFGFDTYEKRYCYCCCTCFTNETPIEVLPGKFAMIERLNSGDIVMAAGVDLNWKHCAVENRTGSTDQGDIPGLFYISYLLYGKEDSNYLLVTIDHLFLMYDLKVLQRVQTLMPGDKIMGADGNPAIVQFVLKGSHYTTIQSIELEGVVDMKTLDGHLLNSNGVVTADYAVQILAECEEEMFMKNMLIDESNDLSLDSLEYQQAHQNEAMKMFLDKPASWPRGFVPETTAHTCYIPNSAMRYLSDVQADDIYNNAEFDPRSCTARQGDLLYLFKLSKMLFPNVTCILDWNMDIPNVYAWKAHGQSFILVTGAMVRLSKLYIDGLSFIMASMQAALKKPVCVCEWDYAATFTILRQTWPNSIFVNIINNGKEQIEYLFSHIVDKEQGDNPCKEPAIQCRLDSYSAGVSFYSLPECAGVFPRFLIIETAYINIDNKTLFVKFNDALNGEIAQDISNYWLSPEVTISKVIQNPKQLDSVTLVLEEGPPDCSFVLNLKNLISVHSSPLALDQRQVVVNSHPIE